MRRKNSEGYSDPTAYEALKDFDGDYGRFRKVLFAIFRLCELNDFRIEGRITLVDKKTGRVWR